MQGHTIQIERGRVGQLVQRGAVHQVGRTFSGHVHVQGLFFFLFEASPVRRRCVDGGSGVGRSTRQSLTDLLQRSSPGSRCRDVAALAGQIAVQTVNVVGDAFQHSVQLRLTGGAAGGGSARGIGKVSLKGIARGHCRSSEIGPEQRQRIFRVHCPTGSATGGQVGNATLQKGLGGVDDAGIQVTRHSDPLGEEGVVGTHHDATAFPGFGLGTGVHARLEGSNGGVVEASTVQTVLQPSEAGTNLGRRPSFQALFGVMVGPADARDGGNRPPPRESPGGNHDLASINQSEFKPPAAAHCRANPKLWLNLTSKISTVTPRLRASPSSDEIEPRFDLSARVAQAFSCRALTSSTPSIRH